MSDRYGLTSGGKPRTRPLESDVIAQLPPVMSNEEAPGYLYYPQGNIWVYAEDYGIVIEVSQELINPEITSRHGTRTAKNKGCNGPLCKKALRDRLYGGAKSIRLQRLDSILAHLQEQHDEEWVKSLPPEERVKVEAHAARTLESAQRRLALLRS